jgi:hypothetical protein
MDFVVSAGGRIVDPVVDVFDLEIELAVATPGSGAAGASFLGAGLLRDGLAIGVRSSCSTAGLIISAAAGSAAITPKPLTKTPAKNLASAADPPRNMGPLSSISGLN